MKRDKPLFRLQTKIAVFTCIVVALALLVADIIINDKISDNARHSASEEAAEIARIIAYSPTIIEALSGERDENSIQDLLL